MDEPASPKGRRAGVVIGTWPTGMPDDGRRLVEIARQVEASGLDLVFVGDHLFGNTPGADALVTLGAMAAATSSVALGTGVLLLPLREPAVAAKQLATIDYLSGGRLVCGIGIGGEVAQEWTAMELPTADRGARTDEYLDLLRALWSGAPVEHHGRFRSVVGVTGSPLPVQPGGPPIWVGGRSPAALARAARHDGWCAYSMSPRGIRERLPLLGSAPTRPDFRVSTVVFATADRRVEVARATAAEVLGKRYSRGFGDEIDHLCALGTPDRIADRVAEYLAAGVDDVLFSIQAPTEDMMRQIDLMAQAWAAVQR